MKGVFQKGDTVQREIDGVWYGCEVTLVLTGSVRVRYPEGSEEVVDSLAELRVPPPIALPDTPQELLVELAPEWEDAASQQPADDLLSQPAVIEVTPRTGLSEAYGEFTRAASPEDTVRARGRVFAARERVFAASCEAPALSEASEQLVGWQQTPRTSLSQAYSEFRRAASPEDTTRARARVFAARDRVSTAAAQVRAAVRDDALARAETILTDYYGLDGYKELQRRLSATPEPSAECIANRALSERYHSQMDDLKLQEQSLRDELERLATSAEHLHQSRHRAASDVVDAADAQSSAAAALTEAIRSIPPPVHARGMWIGIHAAEWHQHDSSLASAFCALFSGECVAVCGA